jgi:peptide/nickel transport system substrate-binding protein
MPRTLFNAKIALDDDHGAFRPFLVEGLPRLNTDTWRLLPDGRMETTYRLKPGLVWHDGNPLTPQDFAFSWQVYATREFGLANSTPFHSIDSVAAVDDRTFAIQWSRPYAGAGDLSATNDEFYPLPRHLLEQDLRELPTDVFARHGYWTREFVGLGPFRLDRWEAGAYLEAGAFDRYVLGRPKLDRVRLAFIADANTTLANLLAGQVHVATDNALGLQHLQTLKRGWDGNVAVTVGGSWRLTYVQQRPELATPRALLDARVRRALTHAVDRQGINEVVGVGELILANSMMLPAEELGPAAERGAARYAYDLRLTEQLMAEAGFARGQDGVYAGPEGRFSTSLRTNYTPDFEEEIFIMADGFRKAGFDVQESVIPAAQAQDAQLGATFPGLITRTSFSGLTTLVRFTTEGIPRLQNRWTGVNRGGWSNPEYDQLVDRLNSALDRGEREQHVERLVRIFTTELPAIPLYFASSPFPYAAALRGPQQVAPGGNRLWNIHNWELR